MYVYLAECGSSVRQTKGSFFFSFLIFFVNDVKRHEVNNTSGRTASESVEQVCVTLRCVITSDTTSSQSRRDSVQKWTRKWRTSDALKNCNVCHVCQQIKTVLQSPAPTVQEDCRFGKYFITNLRQCRRFVMKYCYFATFYLQTYCKHEKAVFTSFKLKLVKTMFFTVLQSDSAVNQLKQLIIKCMSFMIYIVLLFAWITFMYRISMPDID